MLFPCQNGDIKPFSCRLSDKEMREYIKEEFNQLESIGNRYAPRKIMVNERICGAGSATYNITPYGEVNPCVQIRLKKGNSLKDASFMEIWKNNEEIKHLRSLRIKDRKDCLGCEIISYCSYCPASSFLETGSFLGKNPEFCRCARIKKETYESLPNHGRKK